MCYIVTVDELSKMLLIAPIETLLIEEVEDGHFKVTFGAVSLDGQH